MKSVVKFEMCVPALVKQEGDLFIAACPPLDVVSQGASREQAITSLIEALRLFVETCYEMGTLGDVLRQQGLHPGEPDEEIDERDWVNVPISLVAPNAQACAA